MARHEPYSESVELRNALTEVTLQDIDATLEDHIDDSDINPKRSYLKLISAGCSFFVAGVNDGSLGALIPHMLQSYQISTAIVAVIFLYRIFDLGAMLALGAVLQITAHVLRSWLPPFGLFAFTFWLVSLGQAYQDTYANNYVASVKTAHRWLSFIHASYAAGLLVGPFVATAVASANSPSKWYLFYTCPVGLGVLNLVLVIVSFKDTVRLRRTPPSELGNDQAQHPSGSIEQTSSRAKSALKEMKDTVSTPVVWPLCLFFFCYIGVGITAGGWMVEYLVTVRNGKLSEVGYVPAGFNGGLFLGRLLLAEPTHRFRERRMLFLYCFIALAFQLVFWLVPNIIAASVALSLLGFFLGPFCATGISVASKLFPENTRSSVLSFMFVIGQAGGSLFPAITGIIATRVGVKVLQPMMVGLIAATGISWALVPKVKATHRD